MQFTSPNELKAMMPVTVDHSVKCNACDPMSQLPHSIRVTRIRIANLCCSGEESIIRVALDVFEGIEHVAVNVVGRYAVIKHCPEVCCAPTDRMVDALNEKLLGATVQEVGGEDEKEEKPFEVFGYQAIHVFVVALLFVVGLIVHLTGEADEAAMWIYIVATIVGILPILQSTYVSLIVRHTIDIHVLMLLAIVGAMSSGDFFDSSLVVTLFSSAELTEQVVMFRVRRAVKMSSAASAPSKTNLSDGTLILVDDLKVDMVCSVRTGEMIMADGVVVKGEGVVDESALTGECIPIKKEVNSEVRSGTVVQNGYMEFRVTTASSESTMQKLYQEVADVQADRGVYAQIVDRFAMYWTPFILISATLFITISGGVTKDWDTALYRGLLLLVLACPCAIVISAPIPAVCAIAVAARNGVLIRGSSVVERMGIIDSVALDKTGTLTRGFFKVVGKLKLAETEELAETAMACAAAIEEKSSHPLASAIVSDFLGCLTDGEKTLPPVRKVQIIDGVGVSGWAQINGVWKYCEIGNERILEKNGGTVYATKAQLERIESYIHDAGSTVCLLVAVDDDVLLVMSLMDEIRPESVQFVDTLQNQLGFKVSMLTGAYVQTIFFCVCVCVCVLFVFVVVNS
jgi:Cd2+/Zn2+-exporting ATPase